MTTQNNIINKDLLKCIKLSFLKNFFSPNKIKITEKFLSGTDEVEEIFTSYLDKPFIEDLQDVCLTSYINDILHNHKEQISKKLNEVIIPSFTYDDETYEVTLSKEIKVEDLTKIIQEFEEPKYIFQATTYNNKFEGLDICFVAEKQTPQKPIYVFIIPEDIKEDYLFHLETLCEFNSFAKDRSLNEIEFSDDKIVREFLNELIQDFKVFLESREI